MGEAEHARALTGRALLDLRTTVHGSLNVAQGLVYAAFVDGYAGLHERAQRLMGAYEAWHDTRGGAGRGWPGIGFTRVTCRRQLRACCSRLK
jgi:hypothetical protein